MGTHTTRLTNDTPDAVMVRVHDRSGVDHRIAVDKATGEIAVHQYNDYPGDFQECTPEQQHAIRAARANARYVADEQTDADVVRPSERPSMLRVGISVLENLSEAEFVRYFREYYDELGDPTPSTANPADVSTVTTALYLDVGLEGDHESAHVSDDESDGGGADGRLEYATSPALEIASPDGTRWEYLNPADSMAAPDREPDVLCRLPPQTLPVSFGWPFQSFLVDHLKCQIRDVYWLRGEPIPDDCLLEGIGNPTIDRVRERVDVRAVGD